MVFRQECGTATLGYAHIVETPARANSNEEFHYLQFLARVEGIFRDVIRRCYPTSWDENHITYTIADELATKLPSVRVIGFDRPFNVKWDARKLTGDPEQAFGDLAIVVLLLFACSVVEASFWGSSVFALSRIGKNLILSAIVAYFLGQTSHAIASLIKLRKHRWFDDRGRYVLNPQINRRVAAALKEAYALDLGPDQQLSRIDVYLLTDNYVLASGGSVEREMLTAREGFFKSSMVAFAVLGATFFASLFSRLPRIQVQPEHFILPTRLSIVMLAFTFLALSWLFRERFIFFNRAKNNNALLTFLALRSLPGAKADTAQPKTEKKD
ncbi:MAG TPA: hypothetical protein VJ023_03045 [Pyrinomonadaceae bacterium]|nr:hypothetical protein [Pyrinomonadaceae bacterium]